MLGSPPHTRGIPLISTVPGAGDRITPAYAGNTRRKGKTQWKKSDHPRIRGEYNKRNGNNHSSRGSPPHTRGIPFIESSLCFTARITPAYAGNTFASISSGFPFVDHPRIRGEYTRYVASSVMPVGSPPHTRGIRKVKDTHRLQR